MKIKVEKMNNNIKLSTEYKGIKYSRTYIDMDIKELKEIFKIHVKIESGETLE